MSSSGVEGGIAMHDRIRMIVGGKGGDQMSIMDLVTAIKCHALGESGKKVRVGTCGGIARFDRRHQARRYHRRTLGNSWMSPWQSRKPLQFRKQWLVLVIPKLFIKVFQSLLKNELYRSYSVKHKRAGSTELITPAEIILDIYESLHYLQENSIFWQENLCGPCSQCIILQPMK